MHRFQTLLKRPLVVILAGSLLGFLLVEGARQGGSLEFLELSAYDWFIRLAEKPLREDHRITLIDISEQDIQAIGRWPLTDATFARAVNLLLAQSPRAIGLDIYRDIPIPPGSSDLGQLFAAWPLLVGIMTVGERGVAPHPVIKGTEQAAFNDIIVDPGGIVRRGLLYLDDGDTVYTSLALKLASLYLEQEGVLLEPDPNHPERVRLNQTTIAPLEKNDGGYVRTDARGYQFLLDYQSAGVPFRSYSITQLLAGEIPAAAVSGKILLIGVSAQSVKDYFYSPLSLGFIENQQIPGYVLHAHIVNQLLRFALDGVTPTRTLPGEQRAAWIFGWSLCGGIIGFRTRSAWRFSLLTGGGLAALVFFGYGAYLNRWWIPVVPPALAFFMAAGGLTAFMTGLEKRERAMLMQIFSRNVSKEVAERLWQQREQFMDNGRPRSETMIVTVLFSDLKNFTSISEQLSPTELIDWLNAYFEPMTRLIMAHGGVIDSYSGDGIKADFGVPIPRRTPEEVRRDATNAVACALAMEQEIGRLNVLWRASGLPQIGMRIGISTGPVVGGLLGSTQRLKYTTLGDTVNIASRLENFDKEMSMGNPCRILIGETTLAHLDPDIATEAIGEVNLRGKNKTIKVHRVLGPQPASPLVFSQEVV